MCGINGIVGLNDSVTDHDIRALNDLLVHRGPDAQGVFLSKNHNLGLGHTRLSIVDLSSSADQPLSDPINRYWISYNGEIYNFIELRQELETLGHKFVTNSDTEVVLTAYIQWGQKCQQKFNGMWAFAIWDDFSGTLFLSRDRFGVKPLYFSSNSQRFIFSSEQKVLRQFDSAIGNIDSNIAAAAIKNPAIVESQRCTLYTGIERLRAGECAFFSVKSGLTVERWWDTYSQICDAPRTTDDEALSLLTSACELRTRTDVNICTSLSGGIDSSAVTWCLSEMEQAKRRNLTSFSASFSGSEKDEFHWAESLANKANVPINKVNIQFEDVNDVLMDSVHATEDLIGQPPVGQWYLYQAIRENGFKVSIEGHGGDELLGGYPSHLRAFIGDRLTHKDDIEQLAYAITSLGHVNQHFLPHVRDLQGMILQSTNQPTTIIDKTAGKLDHYFAGANQYDWQFSDMQQSDSFQQESLLFRKLYYDFHYLTQPNILRNYDKLSMANSVEVREPMLDYRFVLACFRLHQSSKIHDGKNKWLLRNFLKSRHKAISERKDKLGFTAPLAQWFEQGLSEWSVEFCSQNSFKQSCIFDGEAVSKSVQLAAQKQQWTALANLWPLMNLHILEIGGRT